MWQGSPWAGRVLQIATATDAYDATGRRSCGKIHFKRRCTEISDDEHWPSATDPRCPRPTHSNGAVSARTASRTNRAPPSSGRASPAQASSTLRRGVRPSLGRVSRGERGHHRGSGGGRLFRRGLFGGPVRPDGDRHGDVSMFRPANPATRDHRASYPKYPKRYSQRWSGRPVLVSTSS